MRRLRIVAPSQLPLALPEVVSRPVERWWSLPDAAQVAVLSLLARMITAGVVEQDEGTIDEHDG